MIGFDSALCQKIDDAAQSSLKDPFDVIVVGGGTAGLVSAMTTAEKGLRTLVVEAGPLLLLTNILGTDLRFNQVARQILTASISASPALAAGGNFGSLMYCLGGRGLFWGGSTPRFDSWNFNTWPLSLQDVEAEYGWAEQLFGVNLALGNTTLASLITRRLKLAGYDALPGPTAIDRPLDFDERVGGNIGNALGPLLRSPLIATAGSTLSVCTNSFVSQIIHDGKVASAIKVATTNGSELIIGGKNIVVACGGFESVKLAMSSELPDDSQLMGRLICDHIFLRAYYPVPAAYYGDRPEQAVVYVRATQEKPFQIEVQLPNGNMFSVTRETWAPQQNTAYSAMVRVFVPIAPTKDNYIEALPDGGKSRFVVHMAKSPNDLERQQAAEAGMEAVRCALPAAVAEVEQLPLGSSHHESGGLIGGTDPSTSVVDEAGCFHKMKNIVVADASAWPCSTPYNPHLTIAAIARRQANLLSARMAHGV